MKRLLLLLIAITVLTSGAQAWYNDLGNDSCLTIYSDQQTYQIKAGEPFEVQLKIDNQCGASFNGNLGVFFQDKDVGRITFHTIQQSTENQIIEEEQEFDCEGTIETSPILTLNKNNLTAKCKIGEKTDYEIEATRIDSKTGKIIRTIKKEVKNYNPVALTPTQNTLKYVEKNNFSEKQSVESLQVPEGESYLTVSFTVPAGHIHKHGEFVFTLQDPLNPERKSILDPWWNEGEYTDDGNAQVLLHFNTGSGTTAYDSSIAGSYDFTVGSGGWTATSKWGSNAYNVATNRATHGTLWDSNPSTTGTLEFWFRPNVTIQTGLPNVQYMVAKSMNSGSDEVMVRFNTNGTLFANSMKNGTDYGQTTAQAVWTSGTWYHVAVIWDTDAVGLYVDGVLIEQDACPDTWTGGSNTNFVIGDNWDEAGNYHANVIIDEFAISDVNRNAVDWVTYSTPDANFTKFGGISYDDEFPIYSYGIDGNKVIDFNVFDSENRRIIVDINYSDTNVQGTGTPIYTDLNLNADICPDQNFQTFSECDIDWNYSGVSDGNYFFLIDMNNGINTAFNASPKTVGLASDVNVTIFVPIDEETLEPIDTNQYSFGFTVETGGVITTYSGFTAQTYITVPIGASETTIDIDLNSTDYYGRSYTVQYPTPKLTDSLQPYLVKTSTAGGTGFQSVLFTRIKTNDAIPDVTIEAKKVLPVTGLTTIERIITDDAGSATFSFVSGDTYFLDLYRDGNLTWANIELRPVYTEYQLYIGSQVISVPDINAITLDVNFIPATSYIDSNTFVDLNVEVTVSGTESYDLNILVYFDDNTLFNQAYVTDGFKEIPIIGIVNPPVVPLTVEVLLQTDDGVVISKTKSYTVNLSTYQQELIEALEDMSSSLNLNRHNHHKEFTTLLAVAITIIIVGAISSGARIDFAGSAIMAMLILGVFVLPPIEWIMFEVYIATVVITAGLIIFSRVM